MAHTLKEFRNTISHMPLDQQACVSKRATWAPFAGRDDAGFRRIVERFGNPQSIMISREDLFALGDDGPSIEFVYATYVWGYPNGGRGRFASVIDNRRRILHLLRSVQRNTTRANWGTICQAVENISGVGVSTFTKLLYFMGVSVCGHRTLILDGKVIEVFKRRVFSEFASLVGIRYDNAMRTYPEYLRSMAAEAGKLNVRSDKLEMFLFAFGNSLKN